MSGRAFEGQALNKTDESQAKRKLYEPPELVEWGNVLELTLGPAGLPGDGFGKGGSIGV